jgi:hypothetical protein
MHKVEFAGATAVVADLCLHLDAPVCTRDAA